MKFLSDYIQFNFLWFQLTKVVIKLWSRFSQRMPKCSNEQKETPSFLPNSTIKRWTLEDFEFGYSLGRGRFGPVYLAREKHSKYIVAIKMMSKSLIERYNFQHRLKEEIIIQANLKHSNIIRIFGYFDDMTQFYLILEYAPRGQLSKKLSEENHFGDGLAATYILQVIEVLECCHSRQVIHKDIKHQNILLGYNGEVKIADFGFAIHTPSTSRVKMSAKLDYSPPEIILQDAFDQTVDLWCLGVLAFELLVGKHPFKNDNPKQSYIRIVEVKYIFPDHVSEFGRDFIRRLLQKKPSNRISLSEAKAHKWITPFADNNPKESDKELVALDHSK